MLKSKVSEFSNMSSVFGRGIEIPFAMVSPLRPTGQQLSPVPEATASLM